MGKSTRTQRVINWAVTWDFQQCGMCDQQSLGSACIYAQSDPVGYSMTTVATLKRRLHRLVWAYTCQNTTLLAQCGMCDQQRLRAACAYAQSDQSQCKSLEYSMTVKLLTEHHIKEFLSLKGGCTGLSESTLVKMPRCWKSHITAHEPRHEISNNVVCATSKASDQPAHTHSLIRAFC